MAITCINVKKVLQKAIALAFKVVKASKILFKGKY